MAGVRHRLSRRTQRSDKNGQSPLTVRSADHRNIRIGTYGGDLLAAIPAGPGTLDFMFWGAVQNGKWGPQDHSANAAAVEGGYKFGALTCTGSS